jgi:glycosyltransferase involved in cell wall biosynthesis
MKILFFVDKKKPGLAYPPEAIVNNAIASGHDVRVVSQADYLDFSADIVVSLSPETMFYAYSYAENLRIPFYAHLDWIPRYELFLEDEVDWGFTEKIPVYKKLNTLRKYDSYFSFWNKADYKTFSSFSFVEDYSKLSGVSTLELMNYEIGTFYPGLTTELTRDFENTNKDGVVCIGDFTPQNRFEHVILALSHLGYDGVLRLVGSGSLREEYEELSYRKKINLEFYDFKERFEVLKKSKVNVSLWSSITPLEAAYFGTPTISYYNDYMSELYNDTIVYSDNNIIFCLADRIQDVLSYDDNTRIKKSEYLLSSVEDRRIPIKNFGALSVSFDEVLKYTIDNFEV